MLAGVGAVAAVTGLALAFRAHVPAFSLGALYILAVLPVAVVWGRLHAALAALASMLVFNFLFLPPTRTFTLGGGENWLILGIYLVTGAVVSDLAGRARRRARVAEQREREAAFLAELSSALLAGANVGSELPRIADTTAGLLELPVVGIELGPAHRSEAAGRAIELVAGAQRIGTLTLGPGAEPSLSARLRFLPALASVLGIALERERLAREALEAEALRRSDLLKTALLRTVSHDLRSPLTAIRAGLEALLSDELVLGAAQRDTLLRSALAESQRLDRTVRNLLDLSRLQAGAARPELQAVTLDGILERAMARLPTAHRRLTVVRTDEGRLVRADPAQIEHALVNLLENALNFSPTDSPVHIVVEAGHVETLIRVCDTGPGLAPERAERLFEPFVRGSTDVAPGGAGLGLAIVRGFVEANGGRVWVEQRRGGGSCFVVALPNAHEPMVIET